MNDAEKQARLAEALRANLRRRKVQAREQRDRGDQMAAHFSSSQDKSPPES